MFFNALGENFGDTLQLHRTPFSRSRQPKSGNGGQIITNLVCGLYPIACTPSSMLTTLYGHGHFKLNLTGSFWVKKKAQRTSSATLSSSKP